MQSNREAKSQAILLTFIFPFVGLINSLNNWRASWAKNTFWLACIYLGAVLIFVPEGTILGTGADGGRYVLDLMEMYHSDITLSQIFGQYQSDGQTMDLYQPLMTYLISRFTDNGHVLFAAFAFVFGFFYSRNIWYILERIQEKKIGSLFIIVTLYFLICPITQINGVRMWTALHVFVYGMMPYLLENNKSKLWLVLITPLIHFSFFYVAIFAVVWSLISYRMKTQSAFFLTIALVFFVVTLFINTISLNAVGGMLAEYSPEAFENHIVGYTNEDYASTISAAQAKNNWYVGASGSVKSWTYNILLIFALPCIKRYYKKDYNLMHLYVFTLLLGGFANIMSLIPSGGRFQLLTQMFKVPIIILVVMNIPKTDSFKKYVVYASFFLLLPLVFSIRQLFDYFSITAVLGNFVTCFFWENNVPLMDLIKRII